MRLRTVVRKLEAEHPAGLSAGELFLANADLLPTPEEKKTWGHWSFVSFWIADSFNINTFTIASSMITAGLTWWQALICVIVGYGLVGPLLVLNARPGALWGLTFPVVSRTTFGVFGSLWPVFNRAAMACIWWGVAAWIGGCNVYIFLKCVWPSFARIPNGMPASSETTTAYMVSFAIYWLLSIPVTAVPLHQLRWLFGAKAVLGPIAGFALFGWSLSNAGGVGPVFAQRARLSGSALHWQMLIGLSSCFNNMFTLITNAPDFASRARTPGAAVWPQLLALPAGFALTSFLGIGVASASVPQFGRQIWDVVDIMDAMLDADPGARTRAGLACIALVFVYVQLMLNVAANSVSAGCDLTALCPRFINIRRGGFVAMAVGFAMCPWLMYRSSATFGNYLGAYGVLLSCIAGPMIADYWLVRRGHIRVRDLYSTDSGAWYAYAWGVNWRAYAAYLAGLAINMPGFVATLNPDIQVGVAAHRIFTLSWVTGTGVSALVYVVCCYLSPPPGLNRTFREVDESDYHNQVDEMSVPGQEMSSASSVDGKDDFKVNVVPV